MLRREPTKLELTGDIEEEIIKMVTAIAEKRNTKSSPKRKGKKESVYQDMDIE